MQSGSIENSEMMGRLLQVLQESFPELLAVYLFGSVVLGQMHEGSDIDLAVLNENKLHEQDVWKTAQKLAMIAGRDVDLVDLRSASSVMRMQVISEGRRLVCSNEMVCEVFEDFVFSDYARLNEERAGILHDIQQRGHVYG